MAENSKEGLEEDSIELVVGWKTQPPIQPPEETLLRGLRDRRIRQAEIMFRVAVGAGITGLVAVVCGVVAVLWAGVAGAQLSITAGAFSGLMGTITAATSSLIYRNHNEAHRRVDESVRNLKTFEVVTETMKLIREIKDVELRNRAILELAKSLGSYALSDGRQTGRLGEK